MVNSICALKGSISLVPRLFGPPSHWSPAGMTKDRKGSQRTANEHYGLGSGNWHQLKSMVSYVFQCAPTFFKSRSFTSVFILCLFVSHYSLICIVEISVWRNKNNCYVIGIIVTTTYRLSTVKLGPTDVPSLVSCFLLTHGVGLDTGALKMHDLKMTDKNYGVWKMQDWKMTDKILANSRHNYGVWKMQDWKMTDNILANSEQNDGVWKMQDWKMTDHVN